MQKIVLLLFFSGFVFAQPPTEDTEFKKQTTAQFMWSNDFVFDTDYYFTNGFEFEVTSSWAKDIPVNRICIPTSQKYTDLYGVTLIQHIFTPVEKFDLEKQMDGDRPFAAYLMLGLKKKSLNKTKGLSLISEIQLGVLGPAALGEETQDAIHRMTGNSAELNGWENQISNSLAINYLAKISKTLYSTGWLDIYAKGKGAFGIPYTYLQIDGGIRVGLFDEFPQEFEMLSKKKFYVYAFAEIYERLVGYNATLQGGLFSSSTYTIQDINHLVGGYRLGISFTHNFLKLELATTYNSPEFEGGLSHKWAYALVKAWF